MNMKTLTALIIFFVSASTWAMPSGKSSKSNSVKPHRHTYNTFPSDDAFPPAPSRQIMGRSSANINAPGTELQMTQLRGAHVLNDEKSEHDEEDDEKEPLLVRDESKTATPGNDSTRYAIPRYAVPHNALTHHAPRRPNPCSARCAAQLAPVACIVAAPAIFGPLSSAFGCLHLAAPQVGVISLSTAMYTMGRPADVTQIAHECLTCCARNVETAEAGTPQP